MPPKPEPEAAGISVWPPHAYDGKVRLDVWLTLLEMYMTAKGFEDDSNKQKRMALLQHIGAATLEKIIDWISPTKPQDKTYDELVALLKEKFSVEKNLTALRFKFLTEKQQEGQSLQEYLAHMTQLYGQSSMAQMTVQQFGVLAILQGISSNELRQYLMGPENDISDMSKLQKLACSFEQSRSAANVFKGIGGSAKGKPFEMNVVGKGYKCKYCGGTHGPGKEKCPANGKTCNKCGKKDHFAKVCKSERKSQQNLVEGDDTQSMNGIYPFSVLTVSAKDEAKFPPPVKVSAKLNGVAVNFQHDTGAAVTVISKKVWHAIGKPRIHPSNIELQSYNKHIPVIGQSKVVVQVEKQIKQQWIIVVPKGDSIFGRNWIKAFNFPLQETCNRVEDRKADGEVPCKHNMKNFFSRDTLLAEDGSGSSSYMQNKIAAETAVHASMQGKEDDGSGKGRNRKQSKSRFLKQKTGEKSSVDTVLKSLKSQKAQQSKADNDKDWRNLIKAKSRKTSQVKEPFQARRVFEKDTVSNSDSLSLREGVRNKRKYKKC